MSTFNAFYNNQNVELSAQLEPSSVSGQAGQLVPKLTINGESHQLDLSHWRESTRTAWPVDPDTDAAIVEALALTDLALYDLDMLVVEEDLAGTNNSEYGRNELTKPEDGSAILSKVKAIVRSAFKDSARDRAWWLAKSLISDTKPSLLLYRLREVLVNESIPAMVDGKLMAQNAESVLPLSLFSQAGLKMVAQTVALVYASAEGHWETDPVTGTAVQVIPTNGFTNTLTREGAIDVKLGTTYTQHLTVADVAVSGRKDPDVRVLDSVLTDLSAGDIVATDDANETPTDVTGTDLATVSALTINVVRWKSAFAKATTGANHALNAARLSTAYAAMVRAANGKAQTKASSATSMSVWESQKDASYEHGKVVTTVVNAAVDSKAAAKLIPEHRRRSYTTALGTIWSFDTSVAKSHATPVCKLASDWEAQVRAYANPEGMEAVVALPVKELADGFETINVRVARPPLSAFDIDDGEQDASAISTDYDSVELGSGHSGLIRGGSAADVSAGLGRIRLVPEVSSEASAANLWKKGALVTCSFSSFAEAVRQDAELEWEAAKKSLTPTGLGKSSKCNPAWLLVGAGVAVAASSNKDKKNTASGRTSSGSASSQSNTATTGAANPAPYDDNLNPVG